MLPSGSVFSVTLGITIVLANRAVVHDLRITWTMNAGALRFHRDQDSAHMVCSQPQYQAVQAEDALSGGDASEASDYSSAVNGRAADLVARFRCRYHQLACCRTISSRVDQIVHIRREVVFSATTRTD